MAQQHCYNTTTEHSETDILQRQFMCAISFSLSLSLSPFLKPPIAHSSSSFYFSHITSLFLTSLFSSTQLSKLQISEYLKILASRCTV
ncbi:hypothetical protein VNO78_25279 [Psophocarpus tetragonolobus]|uniref:Uncharacterized protein n=1 Tax=Psophocarpus tetragonolobus TaxID=3891 RepID=A0AAN9XF91_PSOTE